MAPISRLVVFFAFGTAVAVASDACLEAEACAASNGLAQTIDMLAAEVPMDDVVLLQTMLHPIAPADHQIDNSKHEDQSMVIDANGMAIGKHAMPMLQPGTAPSFVELDVNGEIVHTPEY
mmetsp:Transcript_39410/g.108546  ORF Transcript_39410/g.108546 Transcript_39410/m.108546 type:complete len:120 (-) Transcript_39410:84-443(-)|eukprot:CAMPEP_0117553392 /NCGR_PEP_ID=MMETSP0784-20121206/50201_1 /TAXON_ID=39447 /ORGANISM="" /LENGTH=119 /DNA_ID=CAMNT_0005350497 /DNA_START=106 /DNA_END=465 /DNA_ORIENTATION=-